MFVLSFVAAIALSATIIMAQGLSNQQISMQGRLTDAAGKPLDGTYVVKFDLYDVETGGSSLWSETQPVTVAKGLFQTRLGSIYPFPVGIKFDKPYYVGITVNNEALSPRYVLAASPYSLSPAATVAPRSINRDELMNPYVTMRFRYNNPGDYMAVSSPFPGMNIRCVCTAETTVFRSCQCRSYGAGQDMMHITLWDENGNLDHTTNSFEVSVIVVTQND